MSDADDRARLEAKIGPLTVVPAGDSRAARPDVVIVVHQDGDLGAGFARARELVAEHRSVRLFGIGATSERTWPAWVKTTAGLSLTELGALQWAPQAAMTGPLQDEMRGWIRSVCGTTAGALPTDGVLFAGACARFLQPYIKRFMTTGPLALAFPDAKVEHVGGKDGVAPPSSEAIGGWRSRARLLGWGAAAIVGSVVEVTKAYAAARPSLREVERLRHATPVKPTTWVGLVPDWYRMNHHLLEALALPETEGDGTVGVLLVASLHPGQRDESNMRLWHDAEHLWPGLGGLQDRLGRCTIEQAVMPHSNGSFVRALCVGIARASKTVVRVATHPAPSLGGSRVDLGRHARAVATWATLDIFRASLGEAAAAELTRRVDFAFSDVIFAAANSPPVAAVDLALQRAGARTVHHEHGAGGDSFSGVGTTASSVRCLWTAADARSAANAARSTLVTGMPVRIRLPPRRHAPKRVLVMTNYLHRDTLIDGNHFPLEPFYLEMQETAQLLLRDPEVEIRLRPHPADDDATLRRLLASCPAIVLSRGVPIAQDAAWADVIVTSMSTVFFEVLFAGVPVFVHAEPSIRDLPATDFLDPSRVFLRAADGAAAVEAWRKAWTPDGDHLQPELRARVALFGESGDPEPMTSYFGRRVRRTK